MARYPLPIASTIHSLSIRYGANPKARLRLIARPLFTWMPHRLSLRLSSVPRTETA